MQSFLELQDAYALYDAYGGPFDEEILDDETKIEEVIATRDVCSKASHPQNESNEMVKDANSLEDEKIEKSKNFEARKQKEKNDNDKFVRVLDFVCRFDYEKYTE